MKKLFIVILGFIALFLIYDRFFHYSDSKNISEVKKQVENKTGIKIRKAIFTDNNFVKNYIDGKEAFPIIESLIKSAKKTLFIEVFIFHYDSTGKHIAEILSEQKKKGIDVKVIVDSTGLNFARSDKKIIDLLKSKKVDVQIFNTKLFSKTGMNITHRKIILADGQSVIIGGMNFGEEYKNKWHDSITKIDGQAAQEIQKEFLYEWFRVKGTEPKIIPDLPKKSFGKTPVKVVITNVTPDNTSHELHRSMLSLIDNAKKELKIQSPYFSDNQIINAIIRAKKRGVNIQVIMPEHNNHSVFKALNLDTARRLSDIGVDVYFYKPVFSHLKALSADDKLMLGSANIDERSFSGNQEICVIINDKKITDDFNKRTFAKDILLSKKIKPGSIKLSMTKKAVIGNLESIDYYF